MTMTSGMWFSTASIITACCWEGDGTLHPSRAAYARVGYIAVAGDLIGRVHHHDPLAGDVCKDAGDLAQHGSFADPGAAQQQEALVRGYQCPR